MIAKAKAISHGINDIRYITGDGYVNVPANHSTKNIRKRFIGYWTICCPQNRTLWEYGAPCS